MAANENLSVASSDAQLAVNLYIEDLNRASILQAGFKRAQREQQATQADEDAIARVRQEVARDEYERDVSIAAATNQPLPARPVGLDNHEIAGGNAGNVQVAQLNDQNTTTDTENVEAVRETASESSAQATAVASTATTDDAIEASRTCVSCTGQIRVSQLIQTPCQHDYCHQCLLQLIRLSFTDTTLFPPRCCRRDIPLSEHQHVLGRELFDQFQAKALEHSTINPTYCHNAMCAVFLPPVYYESDIAMCFDCGSVTCSKCKGKAHPGACPQDAATKQVVEMARQEGWQRCYKCSGMVELKTGCNHITCRCGGEFCYVCGVPWRRCRCEVWDEARLLDRAAVIEGRNQRPGEPQRQNPREREAAVVRIAEHLRERHECEHRGWWDKVEGRHECEECHDELPYYILECPQCALRACIRCRYNRLLH
ncbi:hypothetical protein F4780DRAFT_790655 [Xylariomycetidae sp. FL0641]|nr:hypothetical protein F4780DRAFT_790655 [Xylariomycetidae sp. FL0641]